MDCIFRQVDPQFEPDLAFQYRLSILIYRDGYSFMVSQPDENFILLLAEYQEKTDSGQFSAKSSPENKGYKYFRSLEDNEFFRLAYREIKLLIATEKICVAPDAFLTDMTLLPVVSATQPFSNPERIITTTLNRNNAAVAIIVPEFLAEQCAALFPEIKLLNATAVFVQALLSMNSLSSERKIFLQEYHSYFELVVTQGAELLYLNTFTFNNEDDIVYYLIFVLEQLGFQPSEETVTLSGKVSKNNSLTEKLGLYCNKLNFLHPHLPLKATGALSGIGLHQYFTLIQAAVCE